MENVTMKRDGNKLVIEIDLSKDCGPSASGKTTVVATSRGNQPVPGSADTFLGINVFKYTSPRAKKARV